MIQFTKEDVLNIATFLEELCDCYLLMYLITVLFMELAIWFSGCDDSCHFDSAFANMHSIYTITTENDKKRMERNVCYNEEVKLVTV